MSKSTSIRWTDSQKQKLSTSVQKFNAKITRTLKQHPELAQYMPEKYNTKEIKQSIKSGKDLNALVKSIDRAFNDKAFMPIESGTGIKTTKWEKHEVALAVRRINLERKRELQTAAPSTEKGTMGTVQRNNLLPKKFEFEKIKASDWGKFKASAFKQAQPSYKNAKADLYKENYLKAFSNVMGDLNGNLSPKAQALFDKISQLDGDTIANAAYSDPILDLNFIYDPLQLDTILDAADEHWNYYLEEGEFLDEE
jgi:hypothetical protein